MIFFPNCKLNLGLNIVGKRTDGYHNLETVFYPLPLQDALEIIHATGNGTGAISCQITGAITNIRNEDNICVKAYLLLKKDFPQLPPVEMYLHKVIPVGAGLGGGSADGAFILLLLNKKFNLGLSDRDLIQYALQLGSDCPFFISNKPSYATGRGEVLETIALDLSSYKIIIVNPGIHINTGWAFSQLNPAMQSRNLKESILQPVENWKYTVSNDFEVPVFQHYPEIKEIKETLYGSGAHYAAMSGSGSTIYGIFDKAQQPVLPFPAHYYIKEV